MPELSVNPTVPEGEKPVDVKKSEVMNLRPDLEFKSPSSGRLIKMGKPQEPSAVLMPSVVASMIDPNSKERPDFASINQWTLLAKIAMYVRSIDNKPFRPPMSVAEVRVLFHELGEDDTDFVSGVFYEHFAPPSTDSLEIIKK